MARERNPRLARGERSRAASRIGSNVGTRSLSTFRSAGLADCITLVAEHGSMVRGCGQRPLAHASERRRAAAIKLIATTGSFVFGGAGIALVGYLSANPLAFTHPVGHPVLSARIDRPRSMRRSTSRRATSPT